MDMIRSATDVLAEWQLRRLRSVHANCSSYAKGPDDITVLTYYWGAEAENPDTQFYRIESAFRETWLHCGMMKSVIVTDKPTLAMEHFASDFPAVDIQVEPSLVPGDIFTMSRDCNGSLERRFDTKYLMIIQDDGFPLRPGLDEFLDKWDFIGAPYVRDKFFQRIVARLMNLWTSNGGFSLRSKRMCDMAARYWREQYSTYPDCHAVGEDAYYTETLIKEKSEYRKSVKLADNRSAIKFSWDCIVPYNVNELPFGFHRAETFAEFLSRGWVQS
jgi:hypothetical protein